MEYKKFTQELKEADFAPVSSVMIQYILFSLIIIDYACHTQKIESACMNFYVATATDRWISDHD